MIAPFAWEAAGLAGLAVLLLIWLSNLRQVVRAARDPPWRLRADSYDGPAPGGPDAPDGGGQRPLVSVVIPARNEERNIGPCLDALAATDHDAFEVVVVDDRSEDGTRAELDRRAASGRAPWLRVVAGEGPPPGWMGKVAACWRGRQEARGQWLLFLDADVRIAPSGLRQCLHYCADKGVDGVSIIGFLVNETFWERVVQPVVGSLILSGNRPERVNDPARKDAMANGQFILVRRDAYDAVGGHAALQGEVLDDVGFARLMKSRGRRLHLLLGREIFRCRMYHGLLEIWNGWSKNLFPGLHHSLVLTAVVFALVFVTALLPFGLLPWLAWLAFTAGPAALATALAAAVVGLACATYAYGLWVNGQDARWFWTYPLGVAVLLAILVNSAVRIRWGRGVRWKGRLLKDMGTGGPVVHPGGRPEVRPGGG